MNAFISTLKTCIAVLAVGICGALFSLTAPGNSMEEEIGLDWLFKMKGTTVPPPDVVIVSIDRESAERLGFSDDPEHWPRSYYAKLIKRINLQNPAVIAFNLHFSESRDIDEDQALAQAMMARKNVILSNYLKQDAVPDQSPIGEIRYEPVIEPIPVLSEAAIITAPFPLPKTSSTVKEFWISSFGGLATFPVCIVQYVVLQKTYPEILQALKQLDPTIHSQLPATFDEFKRQGNPSEKLEEIWAALIKDETSLNRFRQIIAGAADAGNKQLLEAWVALLKSNDKLFLNHYGGVGTIATIPFFKVFEPESLDPKLFQGKIVLVGYSDDIEPEKYQGFYTVYSKSNGTVVSPIELAATAVANILTQSWLRPLPVVHSAILALLWGVALSAIFRRLSYKYAMLSAMTLLTAYLAYSQFAFVAQNRWQPLVIPLAQMMVVILWQTVIYLRRLKTVSDAYLPESVIDEIARSGKIGAESISMYGVCMATDIDKYATLSEELGARQIAKLINDYNAVVYPKISHKNGVVLNNIGDAILAGWISQTMDAKLRRDACHAALEIKAAIDRFNSTSAYPLLTRFGLHGGEMDMGFVGANGRYEYRAVGDTVNTSTRIEGLNKVLGTRILVSGSVIRGLPGFVHRELGAFRLKGRLQPVPISDLLGTTKEIYQTQPELLVLVQSFASALEHFNSARWEQALENFQAIAERYPDDGPTRFFINYLQKLMSMPPESSQREQQSQFIDVSKIAF